MYIYMCVCVYLYIYIFICVYMYVCVNACVPTCGCGRGSVAAPFSFASSVWHKHLFMYVLMYTGPYINKYICILYIYICA